MSLLPPAFVDTLLMDMGKLRYHEFGNFPKFKGSGSPLQIAAKLQIREPSRDLLILALVCGELHDEFVVYNYATFLGAEFIGVSGLKYLNANVDMSDKVTLYRSARN